MERSRSGEATTGDLLAAFLAATVFAPTSVDPSLGAGSFTPLTVTVGNSTALPVFTSLDVLAGFEIAPHVVARLAEHVASVRAKRQ
nr:SseB family protein [Glaciihabitans arcticus]